MKKEASVILAKCAQDKLYGIRIEKRDNDWVRTWAFKLKEETAEKEGFDKINFTGSFYTDEEYPGCPYCGAKKCFVCGNCGKVSCYDGSDKVVCNWCGSNGTAADSMFLEAASKIGICRRQKQNRRSQSEKISYICDSITAG